MAEAASFNVTYSWETTYGAITARIAADAEDLARKVRMKQVEQDAHPVHHQHRESKVATPNRQHASPLRESTSFSRIKGPVGHSQGQPDPFFRD